MTMDSKMAAPCFDTNLDLQRIIEKSTWITKWRLAERKYYNQGFRRSHLEMYKKGGDVEKVGTHIYVLWLKAEGISWLEHSLPQRMWALNHI